MKVVCDDYYLKLIRHTYYTKKSIYYHYHTSENYTKKIIRRETKIKTEVTKSKQITQNLFKSELV